MFLFPALQGQLCTGKKYICTYFKQNLLLTLFLISIHSLGCNTLQTIFYRSSSCPIFYRSSPYKYSTDRLPVKYSTDSSCQIFYRLSSCKIFYRSSSCPKFYRSSSCSIFYSCNLERPEIICIEKSCIAYKISYNCIFFRFYEKKKLGNFYV